MSTETSETPSEPARKSFLRWPIVAAAAATTIALATVTVVAVNKVHSDTELRAAQMDSIRHATQAGDDYLTEASAKILKQSGVQAFHDDPVFKGSDWAAYAALSASDSARTRSQTAASLRKTAASLDYVSRAVATSLIDAYEAGVKAGTDDTSRISVEFLNALNYARTACKAHEAGSTPGKFIAEWTVATAIPKPVLHIEEGGSYAAAQSIAQRAYVAAMAAGVKHFCP